MDEICDPTGAGWIISPEFYQTNDERIGNMNAKPQRGREHTRLCAGQRTRMSVCAHCDTLVYHLPRWGWFHDNGDAERCTVADVEDFKRERAL